MTPFFGQTASSDEGEWISVSDLMAVLMMIFLFVAVVYLRPLVEQRKQLEFTQDQVRQIVVAWDQSEQRIFEALQAEFGEDLERWGAELFRDSLMVRFKAPEVLFEQNSSKLRTRFRDILNEFFPRYLAVLYRFSEVIEEVRIEGHTSSEWNADSTAAEAFFRNMELSQGRTRSVLEYAMALPEVEPFREWAFRHVTANGLSSSRPLLDEDGAELRDSSRRVEFSVKTNSSEQVQRVLETVR